MKMKIFGNIYQNSGAAGMGLRVEGGRLINNRPDGMTGIQQMAMARKSAKVESKINMAAQGYVRGEQIAEMNEMMKPNCNY
jgi:hypothetical protein